MLFRPRTLIPLEDRGPLRVMFLVTSLPIGGAETLLVNLVRRMDRERFLPSLCCLKSLGPLGEMLTSEVPTFHDLIRHKRDAWVLRRLARLFKTQHVDALVTVGAGDKMFWGRLAARAADVPVVLSALHSTGWPDSIGRLNRARLLTRWTDGFIGVADEHGRHLVEEECFPPHKVYVIPNGVDVARFHPLRDGSRIRSELCLGHSTPLVGIVAALRTEKDHDLFLRAAARVRDRIPLAQFLIVGDGPERAKLERASAELEIAPAVHFLGNRNDVPELLAALDVFVLTSKNEANPVSILEAMASGKPVIAPRVGSIAESVIDGQTGFVTEPGNLRQVTDRLIELVSNPVLAAQMGRAGRSAVVARWSLERMVEGYEDLIAETYSRKCQSVAGQPAGAAGVSGDPPLRAGTQS